MASKFIALGCSMTSIPGWVDYCNEDLNMQVYNLAEGASGNQTQVFRLKNYLLENKLFDKMKDIVLLWQITGPNRSSALLDNVESNKKYKNVWGNGYRDFFEYESAIFKDPVLGILSNNKHIERFNQSFDANFEQFVADVLIFSKLVKKIILWYGWKDLYDQERLEQINKLFMSHDIQIVEEPVLDYCKNHNLPFRDDMHPTKESSINWAKNNLLPVVRALG